MKMDNQFINKIKANKELYILLLIGAPYSLSTALSNTFVNIYLWKQSEALINLGIYNLSVVFLQGITFVLAGRLAKHIDRIIVLRIGILFLAAFYLAVLSFSSTAHFYLVIIGGLLGIGYGFYWLAYNVLTFEITEPETRDTFNGLQGISGAIGGMIGPFFAGYVITVFTDNNGYLLIFGVSLRLFVVAVIVSFLLKSRAAEGKYRLTRILAERKQNKDWKRITYANFSQGLREGTFLFVVSVFVFVETGSEMALGTFGLISSCISFVAYFLVSRYVKVDFRKRSMLLGAIFLYGSIFFLIYQVSFAKLLIYASIIAVAYPLLLVPYMSVTYDVIGQAWQARDHRIEYVVVRELYLNLGRVVSILLFILFIIVFPESIGIKLLLILLGSGHIFVYYFMKDIKM